MKTAKLHKSPCVLGILCILLLLSVCFQFRKITVSADTILTPHILTDGSRQDLLSGNSCKFSTDGNRLVKLEVPQNGAVYINLHAQKAGVIVAAIYKNADTSDMPVYMQAGCTSDRQNTGAMCGYLDKGTYYLRFPENNYEADSVLYPWKNMTIKDGTVVAAYCDYTHENIYSFKAVANGYMTISENTLVDNAGSLSAILCSSKGTELTEKAFFNNLQKNQMTYAVKKGQSYKIKLKGLNVNDSQYYQISFKNKNINEKSGESKKKAITVKFGNKVSGMVYAEDALKKADWYKITNPKEQQMILNYSGSITSGSMVLDVLDSKGRKLDSYSVISNIGEHKEDSLHNIKKGLQIPKGAYYLRVTKSRKTATGIYSFSISGK